MTPLSLYELNTQVRQMLESTFSQPLWMVAELSSVSERGMHCYLEFIQKAPDDSGALLAKARGQIWASVWNVVRPYFEQATGQKLCPGMKVMVQVEVTFHQLYGYSLNVVDINPTYTLGDMAQRRQEILRQLQEAGVADMNKTLQLPLLLQRIAVISSDSAAGWGDFLSQLTHNPHHLAFRVQLFPAIMQGERVESTIINALDQINAEADRWDVVVIIRGGGATSDLSGFDTLSLAEHVAQFPLPVITGIGHERDDTVIDLVSHTRVKTPTAAAEFILHHQILQLEHLNTLSTEISTHSTNLLHMHRVKLTNLVTLLPTLGQKALEMGRMALVNTDTALRHHVSTRLEREATRLKLIETRLQAVDPDAVLRLGYSIVRIDGRALTDSSALAKGDTLHITLHRGSLTATVDNTSTDVCGGGRK